MYNARTTMNHDINKLHEKIKEAYNKAEDHRWKSECLAMDAHMADTDAERKQAYRQAYDEAQKYCELIGWCWSYSATIEQINKQEA